MGDLFCCAGFFFLLLMVYRFEESHNLGSVEYDIFAARISAIAMLSIALA